MAFGLSNVTSSGKPAAMRVAVISVLVLGFWSATVARADSDLGAAPSFAVLNSTGDVTFKNRVTISQVGSTGAACPGSVGCPGSVAGTTVLMGRGNAASPDLISGDVIASANSSQGLNCSGNPPGTTAIVWATTARWPGYAPRAAAPSVHRASAREEPTLQEAIRT